VEQPPAISASQGSVETHLSEVKIEIPKEKIADFCRKWKIVELSLFGSVLRDDFRPDSDVDLLVTFSPMQN
jgi:predicted nucleotidyltransferase